MIFSVKGKRSSAESERESRINKSEHVDDVDYWYRHHGSTIRGHYIGYDMGYDASYVYDRDCLFVSYRIGNMTRHLMGNCITSPVAIYLLYIAR